MCLALFSALETQTQSRHDLQSSQPSTGDRWAKRHPRNKVSNAERDMWWVGSEYLPILIVPSTLKNPSFTECSQQPPLLPTVEMPPEAASLILSPLLLCQVAMCPP